ncbi:MAG: hypothetical protein QM642_02200 [Edaphocola sp.]
MKKGLLPSVIFASFATLFAIQGCKKESSVGIDNDQVVKTPYGLYAANDEGWLINSTDGETFNSIFPPDGYAPRLIVTSGDNLLMLKANLHMSTNNGRNFNPVFTNVRFFDWQTMAYNSLQHQRLYITSNTYRGISISDDNGATWAADTAWESNIPPIFTISSFSGLYDGKLFAYSNENNVMFRRDSKTSNWAPVTSEGLFPVDGTAFFLCSNKTTLFLTDKNAIGGVWYSEDAGLHWYRVAQGELPYKHSWNCAVSPGGGQTILVGTDTFGVYRNEYGKMVASSTGLEENTTVYSMAVKSNTYKNDAVKDYVYIGTNKGIYRSEDYGTTWDKVTNGTFDGSYKATY